jgi:hypothetical protein
MKNAVNLRRIIAKALRVAYGQVTKNVWREDPMARLLILQMEKQKN